MICRNEVVEAAKAGDKVVFTGTVAVVPATSGLATVGEATQGGNAGGRRGDTGDGVTGLKKLGARDFTYKLIFVACAVQQTDLRMGGIEDGSGSGSGSGNAAASGMFAGWETSMGTGTGTGASAGGDNEKEPVIELTEAEKHEIVEMRNAPQLYAKMVESVCPSVFGHHDVKRGVLLMLFGGVHKVTPEGISLRCPVRALHQALS